MLAAELVLFASHNDGIKQGEIRAQMTAEIQEWVANAAASVRMALPR